MITLPNQINYIIVKSFWTVFCTVGLFLTSFIVVLTTNSSIYWGLLLLAPVFIILGFTYPEKILKPYIYFNAVLKRVVHYLRQVILFIIHHLFLFFLKSSPIHKDSREPLPKSNWNNKNILSLIGEKGKNDVEIDELSSSNEILSLIRWISKNKKWWLISVTPFLIILNILSEPEDNIAIASDTYTLY